MRPLKRSILPVVYILLGFFTGWYFGYTRPIGKQYAALQQQYAELRQELTKQSQRAAPNWQVEQDAQPSDRHPYGGFWKKDAQDAFGLAIGPASADSYYVSFCGPGGCFAKGEYRPITKLVGDPAYRILDSNTIEVKSKEGFTAFHRCAGRKNDVGPPR
jgi:hypothetical protein